MHHLCGAHRMLSEIRIKSPCPANWDEMTGDERARFCGLCKLSVYNLSDMTTGEAETFLRERVGGGERTCVRMFVRTDGKVMTDNCPRVLRRLRNAAVAASARVAVAVKLLVVFALGAWAPAWAQDAKDNCGDGAGVAPRMGDVAVKGEMVMGKPARPVTPITPTMGQAVAVPDDSNVSLSVRGHLLGTKAATPPPAVPVAAALTPGERRKVQEAQKLLLIAPKLIAKGKIAAGEKCYGRAAALLSAIPGQSALQRHAVEQQNKAKLSLTATR